MNPGGRFIHYLLNILVPVLVLAFIIPSCSGDQERIEYSTGKWDEDSLGYHRAVIRTNVEAGAVYVEVPWRRRDKHPEKKGIILTTDKPAQRINNVICLSSGNEKGSFVFEPVNGPGNYFLYYLPGQMKGRSNYPVVNYPPPRRTADNAWITMHKLNDSASVKSLPRANVISFQSRNSFNSFYPMEIIATRDEIKKLEEDYPGKKYLLFPEDRFHSVRMTDYIPLRWIINGPGSTVKGTACKGEYFTFQLGLYCINEKINDLEIEFTDLMSGRNDVLVKSEDISSFNTGGINWNGQKFKKEVNVIPGKVQPLWFGFMIPENTDADKISGIMIVKPGNLEPETLKVKITIRDEVIKNHGDNNPEDMTRLRWLNSQIAVNDDITKPFIRIERENKTLNILGRSLNIGSAGLFSGYTTFFNESNTEIGNQGQNILASPMSFDIYRSNGTKIFFVKEPTKFTVEKPGKYEWKNICSSAGIEMTTAGTLEFDGYASVKVTLKAKRDIALSDIRFRMHLRKKFAEYFMGLGLKGGNRPYYISWKWDRMKHQEGAWIGNVNGGLQFSLRDDKYERPLNTNFYREKPLVMPESWYNEGRGGINISSGNYTADINCYTGRRNLKEGEELVFRINFLFTPFKPVNTNKHWNTRYYHRYKEVDSIIDYGANVVNVHHATEINPWINYPFLEQDKMKAYIDEAHSKGLRVKIYNTIRELSNRAPELFAIRSLGHEIFSPGEGGGFNWLQEHLVDDYIAAWFVPRYRDAAIINSGMSRWHNYYIEGINWLTKEMGIDGLYLDDVAFDRTTMKRLRKVLDNNNDSALIDLHSANQYNIRDGFTNSANLYMEHFPYINRLWFGEYFDPSLPPDYWLVEMSGLPFGLMGEMLQDGGNQYRGLLYGMTSRAPWSGDPRNIWSLFDEFGMQNCRFIGYWSESCPVTTGYRNAPASVYQKNDRVMVALASWYDVNKELWLNVDWETIGMKRDEVIYHAPYVENFQEEKTFSPWERIHLDAGKGMVLFIEKK